MGCVPWFFALSGVPTVATEVEKTNEISGLASPIAFPGGISH